MRLGRSTRAGGALACTLAVAFAACSEDPSGPADQGTLSSQARDGDGTAQQADDGHGQAATFDLGADTEGEVEGEVRGEATVEVRTGGTWEQVGTLSNMDMSTELQAGNGSTMGSAEVEAQTYEGVRIVLESVEADVEAGSELGAGPIAVGVTVSVGGGSEIIVEHDAPFTVEAGAITEVTLDLNSYLWLDDESAEAEAVAASEFESAAAIAVE